MGVYRKVNRHEEDDPLFVSELGASGKGAIIARI